MMTISLSSKTTLSLIDDARQHSWYYREFGSASLFEYELGRAWALIKHGRPIESASSLMYIRDNSAFIPGDATTLYANPKDASFAETPVTCIGTMLDGKYSKVWATVFQVDESKRAAFDKFINKIRAQFQSQRMALRCIRSHI